MEEYTVENRHAYLIMAHGDFKLLKKLLVLLDDTRNDIYIHVDRKVKNFIVDEYRELVKKARLFFTKRINVAWGGYSQIEAELILLKEAVKAEHSYYHLLSGADLPIKTQNEIHDFFAVDNKKNYIGIDAVGIEESYALSRIGRYHLLQDYTGRGLQGRNRYVVLICDILEKYLLKLQEYLKVNRLKNWNMCVYKGPNWFSITHSLAKYVVQKEKYIKKNFGNGICADELFLQTIAMNSEYRNSIENNYLRYIDWNRGKPYIFQLDDFEELCKSDKLFARKFSYEKHPDIVEQIYQYLLSKH